MYQAQPGESISNLGAGKKGATNTMTYKQSRLYPQIFTLSCISSFLSLWPSSLFDAWLEIALQVDRVSKWMILQGRMFY